MKKVVISKSYFAGKCFVYELELNYFEKFLKLSDGSDKRAGCKQKAIVAVARKLMMKVHAVIKKELDYEINMPILDTGKAA